MEVPKSVSPNYLFFVSFSLFYVWMQRNKRWHLLFKAMDKTYMVKPTGK